MRIAVERDFVFFANNRRDVIGKYARQSLHCGLVIIVPNVVPEMQRMFRAALTFIARHGEPVNTVIELDYGGNRTDMLVRQYPLASS